jgi:hypothetical protein
MRCNSRPMVGAFLVGALILVTWFADAQSAAVADCEDMVVITMSNPCSPAMRNCNCPVGIGWKPCPPDCYVGGCPSSAPVPTGGGHGTFMSGRSAPLSCAAFTYHVGSCPSNTGPCLSSCADEGYCWAPFTGPWTCSGSVPNAVIGCTTPT